MRDYAGTAGHLQRQYDEFLTDATTAQLRRWNIIMSSDYLIVRPTHIGGSYVVPGSTVRPIEPGGKGG